MMIDPPIDKLVEKVGCKYALVCMLSKRTRYLLEKKSEMLDNTGVPAVTYAAKEAYEGKIVAKSEE